MGTEQILKELIGFSGSKIFLISRNKQLFVRKINNVDRNYERLTALYPNYPVPKILSKFESTLDMEYIHGLDMINYLKNYSIDPFVDFASGIIKQFSTTTVLKDYTDVYHKKLQHVDFDNILFSKNDLLEKLPKLLPQSTYHGDFTLENIIYRSDGKFFMIDCVTIEYDSWVFDIAKMRQDLECHWFIRKDRTLIDVKLQHIQDQLLSLFPEANNDYLLILMLLRVYVHTDTDSTERQFLTTEINRLWK